MKDDESYFWVVVCVFALGVFIGGCNGRNYQQDEAIKQGVAYYHPETKAFTWRAVEDGSK